MERTRKSASELAVCALLAALLYGTQVALAALPNIEAVSLLIAVYTRVYQKRALLIVCLFVLLELVTYGLGLWSINYLYVWAALWGVCMMMRHVQSPVMHALALAFFGLLFGLMCAIPCLFIGGAGLFVSYFVSGIPFDLLHCAGNLLLGLTLYAPLLRLLERLEHRRLKTA